MTKKTTKARNPRNVKTQNLASKPGVKTQDLASQPSKRSVSKVEPPAPPDHTIELPPSAQNILKEIQAKEKEVQTTLQMLAGQRNSLIQGIMIGNGIENVDRAQLDSSGKYLFVTVKTQDLASQKQQQ